jgi:membrane protein
MAKINHQQADFFFHRDRPWFLLIASLMINGVIVAVTNLVMTYFPFIPIALISWVNTGITFSVIVILFGYLSFLPDAKVKFRDMLGGAIFTGLLLC